MIRRALTLLPSASSARFYQRSALAAATLVVISACSTAPKEPVAEAPGATPEAEPAASVVVEKAPALDDVALDDLVRLTKPPR